MPISGAECRRAEHCGHPLSVHVVDIDFPKAVNDAWGHLAGDRMIYANPVKDARGLRAAARYGVRRMTFDEVRSSL